MLTMPPIYEEIREAIAKGEKTRYRLWKESGITQGHLSEFMAGRRGLSVENLEKLAACLDLEITARRVRRKRKR